jgi:hypothetical protein
LVRYDFIGMQRTGFKADGLMILVNRAKYSVLDRHPLAFRDHGDRVALFVTLKGCEKVFHEDPSPQIRDITLKRTPAQRSQQT